jgi:cytochrome c5
MQNRKIGSGMILVFSLAACSFQIDKTKNTDGLSDTQSLNSFSAIKSDIFDTRCARCHSGSSGDGGVDLSSYESIMRNQGLVVAGAPSQSRIYNEVLSGDMPEGGPPLEDSEMKAIENWILAGAPDGDFNSTTGSPNPPAPNPNPVPPNPAEPPSVATFTEVQSKILAQSCTRCHSGAHPSGKIDLSSYESLMARPKTVVPGAPNQSLIYTEIESGSMPPRGPRIDPQLVQLLNDWIQEGAKND